MLRFASAEDTVLQKLRGYRLGGETSNQQWLDVLGVLRIQAGALEDAYMDEWALALGVADLLVKARADAKK